MKLNEYLGLRWNGFDGYTQSVSYVESSVFSSEVKKYDWGMHKSFILRVREEYKRRETEEADTNCMHAIAVMVKSIVVPHVRNALYSWRKVRAL